MERLSGTEAVSLHTETSTTPAHTVAVLVMAGSQRLSHERLQTLVGSTLPQVARFRSRLIGKPLGLGQPVWAEIDDYNPSRQIRRIAVPASGGREELAALIAKLTTRPLDRHLPLWQAWSIEGLQDGRWALALKMSQATTGGITGVMPTLARLLTGEPDADPAQHVERGPGATPSLGALVADTAVELAGNQRAGAETLTAALPRAVRAAVDRVRGGDRHPPVRTPFNEPLTERRAVGFASIPLAEVNAVSEVFGVGVTAVWLAACTLATRGWLRRHGTTPQRPLRMRTSLPGRDSPAMVVLPVQLDDPVEIFSNMEVQTDRFAMDFVKFAGLAAPSLLHAGTAVFSRLEMSRRLPPLAHGFAAHLVGGSAPRYCAGGEVLGVHVVAPLVEGAGLTITSVSRGTPERGVMDVTVCMCPDRAPDGQMLADGVVGAVGELRLMKKMKNR
jgi:diacylglycerol O-acyltransferase